MKTRFEQLLEGLGPKLQLKLHVDHVGACSILIPPLQVQLQPDREEEKLFLLSKLGEVVPGKYRERLLGAALRQNGTGDFSFGTLGYIQALNQLVLFQIYPLDKIDGESLSNLLSGFLQMSVEWHRALEKGEIIESQVSDKPPPFGLRP